jgi:hypothetical protein
MPSNTAIDPSQVQWDQPVAPAPTAGAIDTSKVQWDAPEQTVAGAAQAAASGLNAGSADLLGLPVDTARNVLELGKAGVGFLSTVGSSIDYGSDVQGNPVAMMPKHGKSTDKPVPSWLEPNTTPDVGSSAWIKSKLNSLNSATDVTQDTTANRLLHGAAEAVPSALTGNEAAPARAAIAGAAAGAGQQGAVEAGASPTTQAAVGLLAGAAAHRATTPGRPTVSAPEPTPPTAKPTAFEPAPTAPGEPPRLNIGGTTTAADALKQGVPLPAIDAPAADTSTLPIATDAEQAARAQTLRDIGLQEARESAITGNTKETGTDFQTGKLDGAAGDRMTGVIDKERGALQGYAGQLADATSGTRGMDQSDLYNRGAVIAKPIEQLSDHFDAKIKDAYAAATQTAGTDPIDTPATGGFMKNERAQFLATGEGKQLREGVMARMRDLGIMDEDGNVQPASIQQVERLRQFVGDAYTPRTGKLIAKLKDAMDEDVTKAAGTNVYENARATRALRSTLLDDPNGIAKLAAPDDRLGINRAVPLEQVPDYVTKLPVDQFGHVVNVLRDVPAEVQPAASAALNEIRAHLANSVEKAGNSTQGMWNTKGANEYLNKNQLRMAHVFSPDEMGRFKTLADAGNILRMDRTYPGAAAQGHNLAMRGVLGAGKVLSKVGFVGGLAAGHGVEGGATGHVIAGAVEKGAAKLADRALRAQVEKRIRKL